jgi:hypothetical protein
MRFGSRLQFWSNLRCVLALDYSFEMKCAEFGLPTVVLGQSALRLGSRLQFWGKMRCV